MKDEHIVLKLFSCLSPSLDHEVHERVKDHTVLTPQGPGTASLVLGVDQNPHSHCVKKDEFLQHLTEDQGQDDS